MNSVRRILLINPNTTAGFTARIARIAQQYAASGTIVQALHPDRGPHSIESVYDELLSAQSRLAQARGWDRDARCA